MTTRHLDIPPVVSRADWLVARKKLLAAENASTRQRDELSAERRRLPMVRIDKDYVFEGTEGNAPLLDRFDGRRCSVPPPTISFSRHRAGRTRSAEPNRSR